MPCPACCAARAGGLRDAVQSGIRRDLDKGVGATRALHHHHLQVANLHALPLGGRQVVKRRQKCRKERRSAQAPEKLPSGEISRCRHGRDSYQYSLRPSCICRGRLNCLVTRPKLLLLKSVFGASHTTRLKRLNASTRTSTSRLLDALIDFARLTFSFKFQGRRTSGLMRGALPNAPTGCTNAARFKYRSTNGLNVSPAIGARQSAPVTFGRLVPLKIFNGAFVVTPSGNPLL